MFRRLLQSELVARAKRHRIVAVVGPRQSGKTTLCAHAFPDKPVVRLEGLREREQARSNPSAFLARFPEGAILDEIQRVPELFSELQVVVDRSPREGDWILTGSQHFGLLESISQSLAGRVSLLTLLPLAHEELGRSAAEDVWKAMLGGGYPRIHDKQIAPEEWLADYVSTYVERDVRQVLNVQDLAAFQTFLRLCAGRAGQILNLSSLGAEAGVTQPTARKWLSVLETSFLVVRLQPFFRNIGKRLVKSPKLYFLDTGLLCFLLGIRNVDELRLHHLRGSIFENWVLSEWIKARANKGKALDLCYYRDQTGREVDVVVDRPLDPMLVEIKSSETAQPEFAKALDEVGAVLSRGPQELRTLRKLVVYGGSDAVRTHGIEFVPWQRAGRIEF